MHKNTKKALIYGLIGVTLPTVFFAFLPIVVFGFSWVLKIGNSSFSSLFGVALISIICSFFYYKISVNFWISYFFVQSPEPKILKERAVKWGILSDKTLLNPVSESNQELVNEKNFPSEFVNKQELEDLDLVYFYSQKRLGFYLAGCALALSIALEIAFYGVLKPGQFLKILLPLMGIGFYFSVLGKEKNLLININKEGIKYSDRFFPISEIQKIYLQRSTMEFTKPLRDENLVLVTKDEVIKWPLKNIRVKSYSIEEIEDYLDKYNRFLL